MIDLLPDDIKSVINEFDNDFKIIELKIKQNKFKKQLKIYKRICSDYQNLIDESCTHNNVYEVSDYDYHKPRYDYYCKLCGKQVSRKYFKSNTNDKKISYKLL